MDVAYEKGLHEVGDGLFAYLQPDGGWGWSNAGLITASGTSLLVDTLYDLRLTREMLGAMASVTAASPIDAALNTHANPDHCFGNELLPAAAEIYASAATAREMGDVSPELLHTLKGADLPPDLRAFVDLAFGPFDFSNITVRPPSQTFTGRLDIRVGDRRVSFIELGPAHTGGDTIVHVPTRRRSSPETCCSSTGHRWSGRTSTTGWSRASGSSSSTPACWSPATAP